MGKKKRRRQPAQDEADDLEEVEYESTPPRELSEVPPGHGQMNPNLPGFETDDGLERVKGSRKRGINCPRCGALKNVVSYVHDVREGGSNGKAFKFRNRARTCDGCGHRFETRERILS